MFPVIGYSSPSWWRMTTHWRSLYNIRITLSLQTTYRELLFPLTITPRWISVAPDSPPSNLGADQRKIVKTGCRDSIVVDDELCSYGIKAVFPRGQSSVLVGLKQGSQRCNAIEKDRSLRRECSFPRQRTIACQTAKSISTHWPTRRHQLAFKTWRPLHPRRFLFAFVKGIRVLEFSRPNTGLIRCA